MNEQAQALARRAVACKPWQWMGGMLLEDGRRVVGWTKDGGELLYCTNGQVGCFGSLLESECLPNLTDPATLGCLLALVREAWGDPSLCANDAGHYDLMFWHVYTDGLVSCGCQTEAEALVAALEAAP